MEDITNIIFIKGSKQTIVDFINRGLVGCSSKVRVSAGMSGAEIAGRWMNSCRRTNANN